MLMKTERMKSIIVYLDVLHPERARAQHREARLHEKHKDCSEKKPKGVHVINKPLKLRIVDRHFFPSNHCVGYTIDVQVVPDQSSNI